MDELISDGRVQQINVIYEMISVESSLNGANRANGTIVGDYLARILGFEIRHVLQFNGCGVLSSD